MLAELGFNYKTYMIILAIAFGGRIVSMRVIRKYINVLSATRIFFGACLGISFVPLLWLLNSNPYYLMSLEIFTGICWGAFELIFLLSIFEKLGPEENAQYMMNFNLLHSLAIGLGTFAGGVVFKNIKTDFNPYVFCFVASSGLRLISLYFYPGFSLEKVKVRILPYLRPLAVRLNYGAFERPLSHMVQKDVEKEQNN